MGEGEFWADEIKRYKDQPENRLELARRNLPLPAAFREAAIALRALIRAKRKRGEGFNRELAELYKLAAINSFGLSYAPRLKEPGFNVVESMPKRRLMTLPYEYRDLGYTALALLNKTDVKRIVEAWGEPDSHTTLQAIHAATWDEYESKLVELREESNRKFRADLHELLSPQLPPIPKSKRRYGLSCLFLCLLIIALACAIALV